MIEFLLSYFKSWKMILWKCCTHYASKFGKFSSGHRAGKSQFSFQSQRKTMTKNVQTFNNHTLELVGKVMLKILQARLNKTWTKSFQMFKLDLEKAEESELKLPTPIGSQRKQENFREKNLLLHWLCKILWLCGSQQTVENSSRYGNTRPSDLPFEKSVCRSS